jgi:p-hydroxybenzoate 3-monooxygenase
MDMKVAARRQVAIIGEAPAGLPLSHMLHRDGIDSILLERQSRTHVMDCEGHPHNGSAIAWEGAATLLHRH